MNHVPQILTRLKMGIGKGYPKIGSYSEMATRIWFIKYRHRCPRRARSEWGFHLAAFILTPPRHAPQAVTGKLVVFGYDSCRRPGFYMFPSRQNTEGATRQIQFTVWQLERCIDLMGPGVE